MTLLMMITHSKPSPFIHSYLQYLASCSIIHVLTLRHRSGPLKNWRLPKNNCYLLGLKEIEPRPTFSQNMKFSPVFQLSLIVLTVHPRSYPFVPAPLAFGSTLGIRLGEGTVNASTWNHPDHHSRPHQMRATPKKGNLRQWKSCWNHAA